MSRLLRISTLMAIAGLAIGMAPKADAAFTAGNQALADIGIPTLVGNNDINFATGFNFGNLITTPARSGDFNTGPTLVPLATTTFTPSAPGSFTLGVGSSFGVFTGVSDFLSATSPTSQTYLITGTFAPGSQFGGGPTTTATLTVSFTQSGGPGAPISDSASLTVPAIVPEPASIAMVGLGLAGFAGFSARRRSAK